MSRTAPREREVVRRGTRPGWPCAQAAPPELEPGTIVGAGRFVVGGMLGRGGMATVYRGHDRRLDREVALKVMLGEVGDSGRSGDSLDHRARTRRFEHEAELVARLPVHPGLLRLLHAGRLPELAGRPFLATERVEGPTLAFRLASALRMSPRQAVGLGLGLAEGLAAAHGVGVVHRDLTARNVVLGPGRREGLVDERPDDDDDDHDDDHDAQPVLVDFGLAAVFEPRLHAARLTRVHQRPGTVTAMAPEQYRGAPAHPAMDVYALGRLLYQMLSGEDPHAVVSRSQLLACHRDGVRVAPRLSDGVEVECARLSALVDACMEPGPSVRPTAEEVCDELRSIGRALQRGDGVIPLGRSSERPSRSGSRAGMVVTSEVDVVTLRRRAAVVSHAAPRARPWQAVGRAMGVAGALAVVSMVMSTVVTERGPRVEMAETTAEGEPEPIAVAWPSTVVPLAPRMPAADPPPAAVVAAASRATARAAGPEGSTRSDRARAACEQHRERAHAAAGRWAWSEVLEATADPSCWPERSVRTRLRLVAWIEQQRFDACVDEGSHVRDPALVRLVERCRARQAHDDSPSGLRGVP